MRTLVVVAQKAHARFFENEGPGKGLVEIQTLVHPESAARNQDLVTDGFGVTKERMGAQIRNMAPEERPKEREAANFAREVAAAHKELRLSNRFGQSVIVAAPVFLGLLRQSMSDADRHFVEAELDKNVTTQDLDSIENQVGKLLTL